MKLQYWPATAAGAQDCLHLSDRVVNAGEIFEVSDEDAEELLTNPLTAGDVREAAPGARSEKDAGDRAAGATTTDAAKPSSGTAHNPMGDKSWQ